MNILTELLHVFSIFDACLDNNRIPMKILTKDLNK